MKKLILFINLLFPLILFSQNFVEINTTLMNSTFRIEGSGKTGTVFLMGIPIENSKKGRVVLITANHVFNDIKTDTATIYLRVKENNIYKKVPHTIKIRNNGIPLWHKHPDVDLAAIYSTITVGTKILSSVFLATDSLLLEYEVHPGDELLCLGYPFGAGANEADFPILRSGVLASYPLIPSKINKEFLFDFEIFGGNSGGPVYLIDNNRLLKGKVTLGQVRLLIGVVSEEFIVSEYIKSISEVTIKKHPLKLAKVIPAIFIKELLESL